MAKFTHLHLHSEYSMLDGLIKLKELAQYVKSLGMDSVALTDHGVMHGVVEFVKAAKENEIKPIVGVETYIAKDYLKKDGRIGKNDDGDKAFFHLTLLAKNQVGYQNLLKLVSIANTDGFYYKPRIDKTLLAKYSEGIIALSGCYGGEVVQTLQKYRLDEKTALDKAAKVVEEYASILKDDFYIEIQRGTAGESESYTDPLIQKLVAKTGKKLVATGDVHYIYKEDAKIQDIFWAIQEGLTIYDPRHKAMGTDQLYVKTPAEMIELFKDIPNAVETTQEIVEKVETVNPFFPRIQPHYLDLPKGANSCDYLREQAYKGAQMRYGSVSDELKKRMDYELEIIHDKGFDDYFLIVADYIEWGRKRGIISTCRGSGAGSVVAYCLKITTIDPLWWGLQFERFLNPMRPSPPDFDIDFQDDRRDEVVRYIEDKYGHENVSAICAIGRMDTKAAIRDVSRALAIPLDSADKIAKMIPVHRGKPMPIGDAVEKIPELKEYISSDPKLSQMIEAVKRIKRIARHVSVHACGYVITPTPVSDYVPLRRSPQNPDLVITQIEGSPLEDVGLMKYDFLGLRTHTGLRNGEIAVEKARGIIIDWDKIDIEDSLTFKLFQKALTDGVFQLESQGMKNYLKELKPENIRDISFLCAAYRPGAMMYISDYIERKFGKQKVTYLHKDLEPILEETYGFAIYQEQVMSIAVHMAGYSLGEADLLRRAMGKKKKEILDMEKPKLIEGALKKGYTKELGEKLFEYMLPFTEYGFNKAHSAVYAVIAFRTAYLKAHYPVEFIIGLLQADKNHPDKLEKDVAMALTMNIEITPPDINKSHMAFSAEKIDMELEGKWLMDEYPKLVEERKKKGECCYIGTIRYGFEGIKGASKKSLENLVEERNKNGEFKHMDDLMSRVDLDKVDKKTLLLLCQAGAFKDWGERNACLALVNLLYDKYKADKKKATAEQFSLFASSDTKLVVQTPIPQVEPAGISQVLKWEKDLFGIYLSSHPLAHIVKYISEENMYSIEDAKEELPPSEIRIGAMIARMKRFNTKNGDTMAFLDLEDTTGTVSGVIFPRVFQEFSKFIMEKGDSVLNEAFIFTGRMDKKLDKFSFIVNKFRIIDQKEIADGKNNGVKQITLALNKDITKDELDSLKMYLSQQSGEVKLMFEISGKSGNKTMAYKNGIEYSPEAKRTLSKFGKLVEK